MSGFSPDWLALREPADRAARNRDVLAVTALYFAARPRVSVCDLGAGTGSSLRALAEFLPTVQDWTLIDYDPANLAAAREVLTAWADRSESRGGDLHLEKNGKRITARMLQQDFGHAAQWPEGMDLVTASALFDLVSAAWLERFVAALAQQRTPLLSMLTANGELDTRPQHRFDERIAASFRHHQTRDKGFGASAGADAARLLEEILAETGYRPVGGESPWILLHSPLLTETAKGIAAAVIETGDVPADVVQEWLSQTSMPGKTLTVGHRDVFAAMSSD